MSEILIGQSYFLRFDSKLWAAMQPYPPLGSLYAASYLRSLGHEVSFFDAMLADSEKDWQSALSRHATRYAVLFEDNFNYLSKMCLLRMREAAFSMLDMARRQGCVPIAAGADATDHAFEYLQHGAEFVILGEGEHTLAELIDHLENRPGQAPESIPGLAYLSPTGDLKQTGPRAVLRKLDDLPPPAWDLVDMRRYQSIWKERHGYFSINLVTTRGCPFHCNWCAKPIWGQRYSSRSPQAVAAEMDTLSRQYEVEHIWFMDDILGLKPGWLNALAGELEQLGIRLPFKCLNRADLLLRPGEIDALHRAGARSVWIGAESGSQKILDAMEKGTTVEQIRESAQRLQAAGIEVGFFLQFGYPGERWGDIQLTRQLVRDTLPDDIGISVSYPLPGTPFHERVRQQLGERHNWFDSNDLAMLYAGPYRTRFYRQLHRTVHYDFRLRQAWKRLRDPGQAGTRQIRQFLPLLRNLVALPWAELRLRWLEKSSRQEDNLLPIALDQSDAAIPSPQDEV